MTPRIPPRDVRRRDVVLLFVGYPLGTWVLLETLAGTPFFGLAHIGLVLVLLIGLAIRRVGRVGKAIADDTDARLDERQLALRNSAYTDAYRLVSGCIVLGCIAIAIGSDLKQPWVPSGYEEWNAIVWGLFIYLTSLPSAILAWREPDRAEEPEFADA